MLMLMPCKCKSARLIPRVLQLPWMQRRSSVVVAKSPKVFLGSLIILSKNSSFRPVFHDFLFSCMLLSCRDRRWSGHLNVVAMQPHPGIDPWSLAQHDFFFLPQISIRLIWWHRALLRCPLGGTRVFFSLLLCGAQPCHVLVMVVQLCVVPCPT